jgi:SAM-dependent methyltransferase
MITERLIADFVACPACKGSVALSGASFQAETNYIESGRLHCVACGKEYPIRRGVPALLFLPEPNELPQDDDPELSWERWQQALEEYKKWNYEDYNLAQAKMFKFGLDQFFEAVRIKGSVLDVGGGDGVVKHWLKRCLYMVVEPDERKAFFPHPFFRLMYDDYCNPFPFVQGVGESLPIQSDSFDNVLFLGSLDHCNDLRAVFSEARQALKDGGHLHIYNEVKDYHQSLADRAVIFLRTQGIVAGLKKALNKGLELVLRRKRTSQEQPFEDLHHLHHFTLADLRELCLDYGFTEVRSGRIRYVPAAYVTAKKVADETAV